mmetsp:Transcript_5982/g.4525  ORF Transcript_5982/g.4525 Transcript_5982/m.4525 type:complete len:197 (+) Transcript_5982:461-1051(+)|eukprot:CAMPEP_0202962760 /NCGR_PEP_ID=MMETSP1396-20130829/6825_1 /ASSEMBLY_ACC=CAM_ASM_000872 /TAXON_ID= /ORGANISM="Pseudokeronopsis sp., Strain Brazil" /LENGTH=196 /DNA_ID=CAMNT_0049683517 /DNA_START=444 /DNA_END=1034 /DNA_ORIENTATION=+
MKLTSKFMNVVEGHVNRVFALKFDPLNPYLIYSGAWDCYILANDLRERKKVGDILGPYVCGESIDISKDGKQLLAGSYQNENYLGVYDLRTFTKLHGIQWASTTGSSGFVYAAKYWPQKNSASTIISGSTIGKDIRVFEEQNGVEFAEVNSITHLHGGPLTIDVDPKGQMMAFGTQEGELVLYNADGFNRKPEEEL